MMCVFFAIKSFGQCSTASTPSCVVNTNYQFISITAGSGSGGSSSVGPNGYTNSPATTFTLHNGAQEAIYIYGNSPFQYEHAVYIDLNNDNNFSASELIMSALNTTNAGASNIQMPFLTSGFIGVPLKMRVRTIYGLGVVPDACSNYPALAGETQDFTVYFVCPSAWDNFNYPLSIQTLGENYNNTKVCNNTGFLTVTANSALGTYTWLPNNISNANLLVGTSNGSQSYTLNASMMGCPSVTNSISRTFSVIPSPTISVSGSTLICNGQSTTLTGNGAMIYYWPHLGGAQNPVTLNPTVTTIYTVTGVTDEIDFPASQAFTGCKHTLTPTIQVSASPTISISNATVCAGSSFTINPAGATSYTYSGGSSVVSPTTTTVYTVTGSNGACSSSKAFTITTITGPSITVNNGTICAGNSFTINPSGATSYTYSGGSAIVSPTVTSNYVVTGSNGGCATSKTVAVTVNSAPVISASNGTICSGFSFSLSPTGANTYTVSGGSSVVSPTVTTSYTVNGTSAQGCVSQASFIATVNVNPTPTITASNGTICAGSSFTINPSGATSYTYSGGSAVVAPTTNTTYIVTGANGNCSSTKNVTVTVNPLPATYINSGSPNFTQCAGTNVEIQTMAANPAFYSTINGVQTAINSSYNYTVDATYTQTYTTVVTNTVTGCSKTLVTFTITVPSATLVAATSNTNLCSGQSAVLTVSTIPGGVNLNPYTWYPGSFGIGSSSVIVNPTVTTVYTVSAQDQSGYGCNFSTTVTQSVSICTGIGEINSALSGVEVYPNPANDFIVVDFPTSLEVTDNKTVYIINALGEIVVTEKATSSSITLNTDNLTNGIYFVKVESKNGSAIKKFIKQ